MITVPIDDYSLSLLLEALETSVEDSEKNPEALTVHKLSPIEKQPKSAYARSLSRKLSFPPIPLKRL